MQTMSPIRRTVLVGVASFAALVGGVVATGLQSANADERARSATVRQGPFDSHRECASVRVSYTAAGSASEDVTACYRHGGRFFFEDRTL
jgi:hypothetical protein